VLELPTGPNIEAFRQALRELGYVEGQNVVFEYRWEGGKPERLSELAAELVRLKVDVLLASGTAAALAARKATTELPIVFAAVADPVGSGLVASLARPGSNVTGATTINRELQAKRVDLLTQVLPKASRIASLFSASDPSNTAGVESFKRQVLATGLTAELQGVRELRDVDAAFATMRSKQVDALMVMASPFLSPLYARIVERAPGTSSRRCTRAGRPWRSVASCRMRRASASSTGALPRTSTRSSRAPGPPTCPSSSRRSSSW
jgi:putative ABC transport system substrate-binding protein